MQQTGEPLSKDSVDDMIKATDARTKNGRIQYRKLVSTLIHLWKKKEKSHLFINTIETQKT